MTDFAMHCGPFTGRHAGFCSDAAAFDSFDVAAIILILMLLLLH